MNFLIPCHPICCYLIFSNQPELLLIDNICSNYISQDTVSGNLPATISDHLPQFLIVPHIFPMLQTGKPIYLKVIGQSSIMKNSF